MIKITPIPALNDNYIFAIVHPETQQTVIVDPGDAEPVLKFLKKQQLTLGAILITHHHWDHTNGIERLLIEQPVPVYGPANDGLPQCQQLLQEGDQIHLPSLDRTFNILDIPGHTKGHIAYVGLGGVFCGDTLFLGGCGRIFEGSAEQMYHSLQKLAKLPADTLVYCAHEYTVNNLRFALQVQPDHQATQRRLQKMQKLRERNKATVPAPLEEEWQTNIFLRSHEPEIAAAVSKHFATTVTDPIEVFAKLRQWKNQT